MDKEFTGATHTGGDTTAAVERAAINGPKVRLCKVFRQARHREHDGLAGMASGFEKRRQRPLHAGPARTVAGESRNLSYRRARRDAALTADEHHGTARAR